MGLERSGTGCCRAGDENGAESLAVGDGVRTVVAGEVGVNW